MLDLIHRVFELAGIDPGPLDERRDSFIDPCRPPTDVDTTGSTAGVDSQSSTTAPDESIKNSSILRYGSAFAYGAGQSWLLGGFLVPSPLPNDWGFEFWRGAGQFTAGIVEVAAGIGLVGGGTGAAGGGIAGSVATGGASLLVTAAGASAVSAGWAAIAHGATGVITGLTTLADSMSLSKGGGRGDNEDDG